MYVCICSLQGPPEEIHPLGLHELVAPQQDGQVAQRVVALPVAADEVQILVLEQVERLPVLVVLVLVLVLGLVRFWLGVGHARHVRVVGAGRRTHERRGGLDIPRPGLDAGRMSRGGGSISHNSSSSSSGRSSSSVISSGRGIRRASPVQALGDGAVEVLQEEVEDVVVDAPVLLDLLEAEQAQLGAVLGDALRHARVAADAEGVDAQGGEEAGDAGTTDVRGRLCNRSLVTRPGDSQVHLAVAEGALGRHVLGDAADAARGVDDDLVALVLLAVLDKVAAVDEDADVAGRAYSS